MRAAAASRPAALPLAFSSVSTDTRTLARGALYVALKGERFDGHAFLAEAAAKGAAAAVVRKGTPGVPGLPFFEVEDTLAALGALAAFHRRRFSIPVAAIGGSAGKTTTKEMVAAILRTRGPALATEGNFNNEVGVPLTLLRLGKEHRAAVVELGMSAPGELRRITALARPDAAVLTLIAAEHLEFLKNLDGVAAAEGELYRGLLPGSVAVVNADDARCVAQAERVANGVRKILFGKSPVADVHLSRVTALGVKGQEICLEGQEWDGRSGGGLLGGNLQLRRVTVRLGFVGEHNAMNAAAAAAVARALGFSFEEISRGLAAARPYHSSIAARGGRGRDHDPRRLLQRVARIHGSRARDARRAARARVRPCDRGPRRHAGARSRRGRSAPRISAAAREVAWTSPRFSARVLLLPSREFSSSSSSPPRRTSRKSSRFSRGFAHAFSRAIPSS